jgi:acyl-CoA thioesterase FadM
LPGNRLARHASGINADAMRRSFLRPWYVLRVFESSAHIPRHAFSVRDAARAGDVWRAFQEIAVDASSAAGWPPKRYRDEGTAFIVRTMTVRHALEPYYGEALRGRSWISRMRREMFSTREVRLDSLERGPIAAARQEWVHVSASLEPTRGGASLLAAFPVEPAPSEAEPLAPVLPEIASKIEGAPLQVFGFEAWWTWMDPLDHANHPAYLDWCDEAVSRCLHAAGVAAVSLAPVAEEITYRAGVEGGQRVQVESRVTGTTREGHVAIAHRVLVGETVSATATTVRRLHGVDDPAMLLHALGA